MALDEGDVPFFYAPDTSRTLAAKHDHERLDGSVAFVCRQLPRGGSEHHDRRPDKRRA